MNLASKDIRHNLGRFALTSVGLGLLLMVVMGMGGIYQGIVDDAILLVDETGADLWVVQRSTRGPFAEVSRLPTTLLDRVTAVPGVADARKFVFHTIQREHRGQPLRIALVGLDWPADQGNWVRLVEGRPLAQNHYEMIADRLLGLELGTHLPLGKETYTVVGLTSGMIDSAGNGLAFVTVRDAQAIQFDLPGEATRIERDARRARGDRIDLSSISPSLLDRAGGTSSSLPALALPSVSAILVRVEAGVDQKTVADTLSGWPDVSVFTRQGQQELMLSGPVEKAKLQIGLFEVLLTIIAAIIMALILYTMTLDKLQSIALLKLIGAPNRVILGMILQQALLLGGLGYGVGYLCGQWLFPYFPRRVIVTDAGLIKVAVIVLVISVLSSLLGMWKAARVSPNQALSG